ncbi:alpha/beta hydrolase [Pseudanabaena sp. UWO311]|uniref:alpha/beta hydrolase n=1 Tax=Pseudanabaena sp. UWO311 TaxID=2487337 RepID=UPI001157294D|nr:alpha/beta hydrolase [Pseudanabaena sp. UWO311]TYQ28004.1 alpha/beta hydrolase [Pseudanabaena sp. UWO311]
MKYLTDKITNISRRLAPRSVTLMILLSTIAGGAIANSSEAAETVNFRFNIFEVSVSVDDLENFSKTGELRGALDMASRYISAPDMANFRRILTERADVPISLLSRFLYTSQGERALDILGEFIKTGPNLSGNRAIRAAAVLATADKQNGLSLLGFLRKFPTSDIYFDIQEGLQTVGELSDLLQNTQKVVQMVNAEATKQAGSVTPAPSPIQLADLRDQGKSQWERYSLKAPALDNRYEIPFYLFVPKLTNKSAPTPAIVLYPGLLSNREPFLYLAEHLASYGFAVVLTISPNSSDEQLDKLIIGVASEIAPPESFVERPQDITAVLNYLEKSPQATNINWQNVGMVGHSFGGYAALALVSDAQIQFADLAEACQGKYKWNASLLLQCVALGLPNQTYKLGDSRIKAAIAVNPVTSHVLGKAALSKITVPIAIVGSSDDTFAPVVSEQIVPFTWLTSPNRYLVLLNKAGHTAVTAITSSDRLSPEVSNVLAGSSAIESQDYLKLLSVAFFKTHLVQEISFADYLTPTYFANISTPSAQVSLLRSLTIETIDAAIKN